MRNRSPINLHARNCTPKNLVCVAYSMDWLVGNAQRVELKLDLGGGVLVHVVRG